MDSQRQSKLTLGVVVAATAVVVALVIALIVAMASGGDDSDDTAGPATTTSPEAGPEPAPSTGDETTDADPLGRPVTVVDSASGTPREQTGEPGQFPEGQDMVGAPDGLELQRLTNGVTVAVSTSDGPTTTEGEVMTGYAHSARGAGLLAINLAGLNMSKSESTKAFLTKFAPADQREETANMGGYSRENEEATRDQLARGYVTPQHVKFLTCESEFCTVEVALPSIGEVIGESDSDMDPNAHPITRVSMKWSDDQWEIVAATPRQERELDSSWERWS